MLGEQETEFSVLDEGQERHADGFLLAQGQELRDDLFTANLLGGLVVGVSHQNAVILVLQLPHSQPSGAPEHLEHTGRSAFGDDPVDLSCILLEVLVGVQKGSWHSHAGVFQLVQDHLAAQTVHVLGLRTQQKSLFFQIVQDFDVVVQRDAGVIHGVDTAQESGIGVLFLQRGCCVLVGDEEEV